MEGGRPLGESEESSRRGEERRSLRLLGRVAAEFCSTGKAPGFGGAVHRPRKCRASCRTRFGTVGSGCPILFRSGEVHGCQGARVAAAPKPGRRPLNHGGRARGFRCTPEVHCRRDIGHAPSQRGVGRLSHAKASRLLGVGPEQEGHFQSCGRHWFQDQEAFPIPLHSARCAVPLLRPGPCAHKEAALRPPRKAGYAREGICRQAAVRC
mmetsp:Transcript_41383/g.96627  ORF Transcript_41383/g.96627 Transcript_41383/m.96627 type:complete len:209 (+) Transcript_41383:470-1096(+)